MLYKSLFHCNNHLKHPKLSKRRSTSVIKVGMVDIDILVSSHLKEELAWTVDKWLRVISTKSIKNSKATKELKGISHFKFKTILYMLLCGP